MPFAYFPPGPELQSYIQSYWTLKGGDETCDILYPDGCIDVIVSLGERFVVTQKDVVLEPRGVYIGGALTEAIHEKIPPGVHLLGVRFQPGSFGHFYPSNHVNDLRDDCVRVHDDFVPPVSDLLQDPVPALNRFYTGKLVAFHNPVREAAAGIIRSKGNATLNEIALACLKSPRQTERLFKQQIGLTPKQFCRIVKYACTQELLATKGPDETILAVALAAGYYDHAHLTKEYKRITRLPPTGK